ncbi:uncharacterized protein O3C94_021919 [Discoglossus pictus]
MGTLKWIPLWILLLSLSTLNATFLYDSRADEDVDYAFDEKQQDTQFPYDSGIDEDVDYTLDENIQQNSDSQEQQNSDSQEEPNSDNGTPRTSFINVLPTTPVVKAINTAHNSKICSTWGNFHFKNFDGDIFYFPGTCNYVYSSHCKSSYEEFNIQIRRTVIQNIPVIEKITMKIDGLDVQINQNTAEVDGQKVKLPFSGSGVQIEKLGVYLKVSSKLGLVFMWNDDGSLLLELDDKYANQTCGLCGDYNSIPMYNEFISNGIQVTETQFGNLQKLNGPTEQCQDPPPTPKRDCIDYENICERILMGSVFSKCHSFVGVQQYIEACVQDLCRCDRNITFLCLCDTFAEYSRQCAHAGGQPQNWRTKDLCPLNCPFNMNYQECGSPCADTCSNPERGALCEDHCLEGCFCPRGTVLDDINNSGCVPIDKCSCTYNSDTYAAGTSFSTPCSTCVCSSGKWNCQNTPCPATCSIEGGSHVISYDQTHYNIHGDCNYVMSKMCSDSTFTILSELRKCGLTESETCLKSATIILNSGETIVVIKPCGSVYINGMYTTLPISAANVTIFRPSSFYIIFQSNLGIQVVAQLTPFMQLYVVLDPSFKGKTCGLCGNFNDKQSDDFQTINGVIEGTAASFANTWKTQGDCPNIKNVYEDPCSLSVENAEYAQHWCGLISDPSGPFAPCHSSVLPTIYQKNCMFDTCNCAKSEDCMCTALSSYVRACAAKGVVLTGWRSNVCTKYINSCPMSLNYTYSISTCQPTCRSLSEPDVTCTITFVPVDGCTCSKGFYMDDTGKCVPAAACPCYYKGTAVPAGEVVYDNEAMCTCSQGKLSCMGSSQTVCSSPMIYFDCKNTTVGTKGAECQKSCQTLDMECYSPKCVSGCVCPQDLLSDGKGGCIKEEQCPCVHNDATYQPGEKIKMNCNTCTCKNRMWQCTTNPCLGTCAVYGDGHYLTFDGKRYSFNGDCEYTLVQDNCGNSGDSSTFRVITENIPCGTTGTTCSKAIKIFLGSNELILTDEHFEVIERGIGAEVPYKVRNMGIYLVLEADNGLILMWDKKTSIFIKLSYNFEGNVCGLCGDYDGNGNNDFTTRSMSVVGDVIEFGNSWKLSPSCPDAKQNSDPCSANPYRKSWALKKCSIVNSDVFSACHVQVDPLRYYDACVTDSCACDTGGDCECFCTAIAAYAQACGEAGICVSWRTPDICPLFCDYYNPEGECEWHYKPCGAPCMKTCRNPSGKCIHELSGLEGCYANCPIEKPYYNEDTMQCVSQCEPLCYNITENCQSCECTPSGTVCKFSEEACHCAYNKKIYNYNDVIYNTTDGIGGCITAICKENGTIYRDIYSCVASTTPTTPPFTFTTTPSTTTKETTTTTEATTSTVTPETTTTATTSSATLSPTICVPTWSSWIDVSYPHQGAKNGDFETFEKIKAKNYSICDSPLEIKCRALQYPDTPLEDLGQNVQCDASVGLICNNYEQVPPICYNYEIKVKCCNPEIIPPTSTATTILKTTEPTTKVTTTSILTTETPTSTAEKTTTSSYETSTTTQLTTTAIETTTHCFCHHEYSLVLPGNVIYNKTDESGCRFYAICNDKCEPERFQGECPSTTVEPTTVTIISESTTTTSPTSTFIKTTTPSVLTTTSTKGCPPRKTNETWMLDNCTLATCHGNDVITTEKVKCAPIEEITCDNEFRPVLVSDGCCSHYECKSCQCEYNSKIYKCNDVIYNTTDGIGGCITATCTENDTIYRDIRSCVASTTPTTPPFTFTTTPSTTTKETTTTTESTTTTETPVTTTTATTSSVTLSPTVCVPTWSSWIDVSYPHQGAKNGDFETFEKIKAQNYSICDNPLEIKCRALRYPDTPLEDLGQNVQCDASVGLICNNYKQVPPICYNYEIKVKCCNPDIIPPTSTATTTLKTTEPTTKVTTTSILTTETPTSTAEKITTSTGETSTTTQLTTTAIETTTHCFCHHEYSLVLPGNVIYNKTDEAGCRFYAICNDKCEPDRFQGECPSTTVEPTTVIITSESTTTTSPTSTFIKTTTPSVLTTSSTKGCPPRKTNETWMFDNCTIATCHGNDVITIEKVKCPPLEEITCDNDFRPVLVSDGCCSHYECECVCSGWGDPHYITFDGTYYTFLDNCTYVLVQEITPKYDNFRVLVDNYFCNAEDGLSCPQSLIIDYKSTEVILTREMYKGKMANRIKYNQEWVSAGFTKDGITITSAGINMIVEIPEINAYISFSGMIFVISLPFSKFGYNTEGQCGTCSNNKTEDCRLPSGRIVQDCSEMAPQWLVNITDKDCPGPPSQTTPPPRTTIPIPSSTTPHNTICDIINSEVFSECHKEIPPKPYHDGCIYDVYRMNDSSVQCSSLEIYASLCTLRGICVDWRRETNGYCPYECPTGKVYNACGPVHFPTCDNKDVHVSDGLTEGCFCPSGTKLFNTYSDVCVTDCTCVGPDGMPKQASETWVSNCQECVCKATTLTVECQPLTCATPEPVICDENKFVTVLVPDLDQPCCPPRNECKPIDVCVVDDVKYQANETWKFDNCKIATCHGQDVITIETVKCPLVEEVSCDNNFQAVKVYSEDGCCYHYACEFRAEKSGVIEKRTSGKMQQRGTRGSDVIVRCPNRDLHSKGVVQSFACVCSGWGDPHYVTFDGTYYTFLDNCTYVLVQEITPKYDNFRVYIDNYFCDAEDGLSCPQSLLIYYKSTEVILTRVMNNGKMTNQIKYNQELVRAGFTKDGITITSAGINMIVEIPEINAYISFSGMIFIIRLPFSKFGYNTEGQCESAAMTSLYILRVEDLPFHKSTCSNNQNEDCRLPSGRIVQDCSEMAPQWHVNVTDKDCPGPPSQTTPPPRTTIPIPSSTTPHTTICDIINSEVFSECHKEISPKPYLDGCIYDVYRMNDSSVQCSSLEIYASLCTLRGICVDWRRETNGYCPYECPTGKVYNACGPVHFPTCDNKEVHVSDGLTEGCFCPSGTKLFSTYSDVCVTDCTCVGPDGMPKQASETWVSNCQECVCKATTLTVECQPLTCATPEPVICDENKFVTVLVPDLDQPCCPPRNECKPIDVCVVDDVKYQANETWKFDNCKIATCHGQDVITIETVKCPLVEEVSCDNNFQAVKVYSEDGCCYHYACECVCSGWGDPHYVTFDGTYYTFLDNCTYVLVQEITPKYDNFRVYIDNYFCDAEDGLSCPQSLLIYYKSTEVILTRVMNNGKMTNQIKYNQELVRAGFTKDGITITSAGINMIVEIPEINAYISFSGMIFIIRLPFSKFGYNTEGQCGTCSNNQNEDCRLPSGRIVQDCSEMAPQWHVNVTDKDCPGPPSQTTPPPRTTIPITSSTTPHTTICDIINSEVFSECHKEISPKPYHDGCIYDVYRMNDSSVQCSSLEIYASLCTLRGICVDWRRETNGYCPYECPTGKVYNACGPVHFPTCDNKEVHVSDGLTEGCFCPSGTKLFSTYSDVCVTDCTCFGPDGMPKQASENWVSNCQECVCKATTLTVECQPLTCATPEPVICDENKFVTVLVPDLDQPCCPPRNECKPIDVCVVDDVKYQANETWKFDNCKIATCHGQDVITIETVKCPLVEEVSCDNNFQAVKVYSEDGCCYHYACECVCSGWGDPHYVTFDGTYYTFLDNCTYVLVQEITPKYDNFRVYIDNYFCDAEDGLSCPQSLLIYYKSTEVILTRVMNNGKMTNQIKYNQELVRAGFTKDGITITSAGINMIVEIPEINAYISFSGMIFIIRLPFSKFGYNTEGQCGTCSNNQNEDCRLPSGRIVQDCSEMAPQWHVNVTDKDCPGPPSQTTPPPRTTIPIPSSTTPHTTICDIINSEVFSECHKEISPKPYHDGCIYDVYRMNDSSVQCSSLEIYASLCTLRGICVDWRRETNGYCPYECPTGKVYNACGPVHFPTCDNKEVHVSDGLTEGCFCPSGTKLFSTYSDVCVTDCTCVGPDGMPKQASETWVSNCQECVCKATTLTVECQPLMCATPEPVICDETKFVTVLVPDLDQPCCPARNECKPIDVCVVDDVKYQANETWKFDNCKIATCHGQDVITIETVKCPLVEEVSCDNNFQAVKVYSEDGCCYHYACECVCSGWGDPHYVTFDGTYYTFLDNCTYVLVQEITPKYDNFRVYIDNYFCDAEDGLSCPQSLLIYYKATEVILTRVMNNGKMTNQIKYNQELVRAGFTKDGITITSAGINMIVEIPEINAYISFSGMIFIIRLPFSKFGYNTEGQCGTCSNNQNEDCRLPSGRIIQDCSEMAPQWHVNVTDKDCPGLPSQTTPPPRTTIPIPSSTTPHTTICDIINSEVFSECHKEISPKAYHDGCIYDVYRMNDSSVQCSSLEIYASLCTLRGICVDWRRETNGYCPYECPTGKVYNACGPVHFPTCNNKEVHVSDGLTEGCFCPSGTKLFNTYSDVCVTNCSCVGPDGMPKQASETWVSNCQECVCKDTTLTVECQPLKCATPEPVICDEDEFVTVLVPDLDQPCCPARNECKPRDICVVDDARYQANETWKFDNCTIATCHGKDVITIEAVKCPPVEEVSCDNNFRSVKVYSEDGCCYHYECECVCSGWGDPHYITFDGTYYTFLDNCTYVLVQEITPRFDNFRVYIDNYFCDAEDGLSCPQSLLIYYKSTEVILTRVMNNGKMTNQIKYNQERVSAGFTKDGITITSAGINMIVEIPEINAYISFSGMIFLIRLPFSKFGYNTEGQCGTCSNNKNEDCRLPSGRIVQDCSEMAPQWLVNVTDKDCPGPPSQTTPPPRTTIPIPSSTTPHTTICDIINSEVFSECHKEIPPKPYHEGCIYDVYRMNDSSVQCSSLEIYASLCTLSGICVDWRRETNGYCPYDCPTGKVYNACGPVHFPTCDNRDVKVSDGLTEGCFCPPGTKLFNTYSDICVTNCSCVGPDGMPKQASETWVSNCQECVCKAATLTVECQPLKCATPEPVICDKDRFVSVLVPNLDQPCCPTRNECSK